MPRGDRTGKSGMGPMTGRAMGLCAGYDVPGYANTESGKGSGMGMGLGRGKGSGKGMGSGRGMAHRYGSRPELGAPVARQKTTTAEVEREIDDLEKKLSALRDTLASLTKGQES